MCDTPLTLRRGKKCWMLLGGGVSIRWVPSHVGCRELRGKCAEKLAQKSHKEGQVCRKTGTKISQKHATAPVGTRHMGRVGVGEDSR